MTTNRRPAGEKTRPLKVQTRAHEPRRSLERRPKGRHGFFTRFITVCTSRQHACRMRSHALMSMRAAVAGMSHVARLAAWPLDTGRRTPLASVRDSHTVTGTALCTIGLVRTSPSRRAHRGPYPDRFERSGDRGNRSIYILYAYAQTGSEALPTIGNQWAATAAQLDVLRDCAKQHVRRM